MAVSDASSVSWLSHTGTDTTFLSKAINYFSHMYQTVDRRKIAEKKAFCHDRVSNPDPTGHESNAIRFEVPGLAFPDK